MKSHAYGQDVSGNWVPLRTDAVGDLTGIGDGAGIPAGQPVTLIPWSYAAASGGITDTADVTLVAAAGAGKSSYLTSLQICNTSATATEVVVKSGTTVLWRCKIGASMTRPAEIEFLRPLISANNTALTFACITTGTATYIDAQGYTDETVQQLTSDLTAAEEIFDEAGAAITDQSGYVITLPGNIQDSPIYVAPANFPMSLFSAGEQGFAWDMSNTATLFQERTGASATTPASATTNPVGSVKDLSGNGNWFTVPTNDTKRPLLDITTGLYSIVFDGTDDEINSATAGLFTILDDRDWFIGVAAASVSGGEKVFLSVTNGSSYVGILSGGADNMSMRAGSYFNGGTAISGGEQSAAGVYTFNATSGTAVLARSGVSKGSVSIAAATFSGTQAYVGSRAGSLYTGMKIYRMIVCARALTAGELATATTWLGAGAGLSL